MSRVRCCCLLNRALLIFLLPAGYPCVQYMNLAPSSRLVSPRLAPLSSSRPRRLVLHLSGTSGQRARARVCQPKRSKENGQARKRCVPMLPKRLPAWRTCVPRGLGKQKTTLNPCSRSGISDPLVCPASRSRPYSICTHPVSTAVTASFNLKPRTSNLTHAVIALQARRIV